MTRERFTRQLAELREDMLRLGNRVEYALSNATKSMETWDSDLASQVIAGDSRIDDARKDVEERVITLIATQQPVASDLRLLGAVFAIASELERIGDYACSIARRLQRATSYPRLVTPPNGVYDMASLAQKMLHMSLEAFLHQDTEMAHSLAEYDNRVDELEDTLRHDLLTMVQNDPERMEAVLDLLDVVHAFERAADRATNVAERVIYLVTSVIEDIN